VVGDVTLPTLPQISIHPTASGSGRREGVGRWKMVDRCSWFERM